MPKYLTQKNKKKVSHKKNPEKSNFRALCSG